MVRYQDPKEPPTSPHCLWCTSSLSTPIRIYAFADLSSEQVFLLNMHAFIHAHADIYIQAGGVHNEKVHHTQRGELEDTRLHLPLRHVPILHMEEQIMKGTRTHEE